MVNFLGFSGGKGTSPCRFIPTIPPKWPISSLGESLIICKIGSCSMFLCHFFRGSGLFGVPIINFVWQRNTGDTQTIISIHMHTTSMCNQFLCEALMKRRKYISCFSYFLCTKVFNGHIYKFCYIFQYTFSVSDKNKVIVLLLKNCPWNNSKTKSKSQRNSQEKVADSVSLGAPTKPRLTPTYTSANFNLVVNSFLPWDTFTYFFFLYKEGDSKLPVQISVLDVQISLN